MKILAIETSCDETSISILGATGGFGNPRFEIFSNIVLSQIETHKPFYGVVPSLAKREHQKNLMPILVEVLSDSGLLAKLKFTSSGGKNSVNQSLDNVKEEKIKNILAREQDLLKETLEFLKRYKKPSGRRGIGLIAVTRGPGLEPALWVGVNFAKSLATAWGNPITGVNHLEGHIFSVFLDGEKENLKLKKIKFPTLALVVSGGHTELVLMKKWLDYRIIGRTLDDAAGEAFDKAARMLGLGYPGGPVISLEAEKWKSRLLWQNKIKNPDTDIKLPRPMLKSKDFNFSFSGLKTAVLYLIEDLKKRKENIKDLIPLIAYEFQEAVIDVLAYKSANAFKKYGAKTFILCGGVSANKELRLRLEKKINEENKADKPVFLKPSLEFSGDNAAMIAAAAYLNFLKFKKTNNKEMPPETIILEAEGNLNFKIL